MRQPQFLILDRDPAFLYSVSCILEDLECGLKSAMSKREGLLLIEGHSPLDVVVCNFDLADNGGLTFLRTVWKCRPETQRILLVHTPKVEWIRNLQASGMISQVTTKPCFLADVYRMVKDLKVSLQAQANPMKMKRAF